MHTQSSQANHDDSAQNDSAPSLDSLPYHGEFIDRHIGPSAQQIEQMLQALNVKSLDELIAKTVPEAIALNAALDLDDPLTESAALAKLKAIAAKNTAAKSFIGLGYYDTFTPNVILRNVLENPGWYTAYTPYQPEISQGRLECLLNFQQMTLDLTAMDLANASLLDEATAAAEAMSLAKRVSKNRKANKFFVDQNCFPQTIDVIKTRAECFGFELIIGDIADVELPELFGAIFHYPAVTGQASDLTSIIEQLHEHNAIAIVAADLMSLTLLKPPGEMGADVVTGTTQRFGVPMGYGGPHAAYFATKEDYKRAVPGRIIGVSVDKRGRQAFRMALQTREQHIRRETANSNICTAQVLLANISALYAMYHGPKGLQNIAQRIHRLTSILAAGLEAAGIELVNNNFFDTLTLKINPAHINDIVNRADAAKINLRIDNAQEHSLIGVSLDECSTSADVKRIWKVVLADAAKLLSAKDIDAQIVSGEKGAVIPENLVRRSDYLQHPNFNSYHSETEMMRYLKRLEDKDISLTHAMIPLGSCTMKLNAAAALAPIRWPEFSKPHPFTPIEQMAGYKEMIHGRRQMQEVITGFVP